MGGNYSAPSAESMASVLQAYQQYIPGIASSTASGIPTLAGAQLGATQDTQDAYNKLNLDQLNKYGLPTAVAGQQVADSNAQAGAATNLKQIQGAGGSAAQAAVDLNKATNPNYYTAQNAASTGAANAVNAINLNGLSPGEFNATERANNQNLTGTGNLGLNNNTNTIANAMNFGGAFNSKVGLLNNAVNSASGAANSAAGNGGVNAANIALGQPNVSTAGNFGTGTFNQTNAGTQNAAGSNATSIGNSLLGNMTSANNAATSGAYGLAQANAIPNYIPNISC